MCVRGGVYELWSQVPLQEMEGFITRNGTSMAIPLHTVSQIFGGPGWGCGQHGHQVVDCPRCPQQRTADEDNFAGALQLMAC